MSKFVTQDCVTFIKNTIFQLEITLMIIDSKSNQRNIFAGFLYFSSYRKDDWTKEFSLKDDNLPLIQLVFYDEYHKPFRWLFLPIQF